MADKRKRRRGEERLFRQLGIRPKPVMSTPEHAKENKETKAENNSNQPCSGLRRSLRRQSKLFFATPDHANENKEAKSEQNRNQPSSGLRRSVRRQSKLLFATPDHEKENKEEQTNSQPTSAVRRSLRRQRRLFASLGVGVASKSTDSKASCSTAAASKNVGTAVPEKNVKPQQSKSRNVPQCSKSRNKPPKEVQKPKQNPKSGKSRSSKPRNQIKSKNPKLCETSVLDLTPLKSLRGAATLGFIDDMSPMSFGTPAAKKKCSRKRDPMELSPTFRSKNYKSALSKKSAKSKEEVAVLVNPSFFDGACKENEKENNPVIALRQVLADKMNQSDSEMEEEDEYF